MTLRSIIWQCFPSFCASLVVFSFGLMLGWPSPSYPYLLQPNSSVPITMDQSAMIAGFLMIGASISSPFSSKSCFGTKYGIIFSLTLNLIGWIIVWFGTTIYHLLAGRLLIGICHGYGHGQVKKYIKDLCEPKIAQVLIKLLIFHLCSGIFVTFLIGCFKNYNTLILICIGISCIVLFLNLLIPHSPVEYLKFNKERYAVKVLRYVNSKKDVKEEVEALRAKINYQHDVESFGKVLKNKRLRMNFFIIVVLTIFQQFTGLPATIVYCKIIFAELKLPLPEIYSTIYSLLFLCSNVIATFYFVNLNKKLTLFLSNLIVSILIALIATAVFFNVPTQYPLVCLIFMYLYQFFHTVGFGTVPAALIQDLFPSKCRTIISMYHLVVFCMSALLITKIFQVLYNQYYFYVPFCLFFIMSIFALIFTAIFVPNKPTPCTYS